LWIVGDAVYKPLVVVAGPSEQLLGRC
jgi:hypothetical protein